MPESPDGLPRRTWLLLGLQVGLVASIGTTLGAIFYPVVRFLRPRRATTSGAMEMVAPYRLSDLKGERWPPPFNFEGKPCLLVPAATFAEKLAAGEPIKAEDLRAFNAICTHLDCTVEFRAEKGDIYCPCHNGVYDLNGRNISGPPPRPLESYKVSLQKKPGPKPGQEEVEIVVSRST